MTEENLPPMLDFYTRYYQAVASSEANAEYCAQVYGRNLSQHGFAEMAHLDHLARVSAMSASCCVLDLGCGNGMIAEYLSDLTGAQITGIDFIPRAIQDALERTQSYRDRLDFKLMDMTRLVFPPASFDVIISIDTLYFSDVVETLRGCLPLLKKDGRIAAFFDQSCEPDEPLEDYPSQNTWADNTEIAQAFQQLGLSYRCWDYSEAMLAHARNRRPVLAALKAKYEAEDNLFLHESHLGESIGIERAYTHNAGRRYLYLASKE